MTLKFIQSESIPNGTKFVAIYGDGSGARLFMIDKDGHIHDGESKPESITLAPDTWLMDSGFIYWIELPRTFKLWIERDKK